MPRVTRKIRKEKILKTLLALEEKRILRKKEKQEALEEKAKRVAADTKGKLRRWLRGTY